MSANSVSTVSKRQQVAKLEGVLLDYWYARALGDRPTIMLNCYIDGPFGRQMVDDSTSAPHYSREGEHILMRAYIASKFGEEVEL